ncbi:hypothetical protein B0H17DRAFT_1136782 [Mycena rosella]|uniref:S-adenosyl-L-methionine-dependent methyltransferase n=1 Tax=Mycena rosella TaxID=1033263 RepID=A0AAD7GBJ2_MYCRO|nr:hypothetical protein B0H17DRAFT_1136782 [Mycena rosella]
MSDENRPHLIAHAARAYQTYPGAQYLLPADLAEGERCQSGLPASTLEQLFGIVLAPVHFGEGDKVLDVGTGPGPWILDLAESAPPSVSLVSIDIEPTLFPPSISHPTTLEFRAESTTVLPAAWTAAFSLVHQRLAGLSFQTPEWPVALRELYPGAQPNKPCMEALVAMQRALTAARDLHIDCVHALPTMFSAAGFLDIHLEAQTLKLGRWAGALGVAMRTNHVEVFRGLKTPVLEVGGYELVASEEAYDALLEGLGREWDAIPTTENPGTQKEFVVFWARKSTV